jgi:hypothetical protein
MWPLPHPKPTLKCLDASKAPAPCWHELLIAAAVILVALLLLRPVIALLFV